MIFEDDIDRKTGKPQPRNLTDMSVFELNEYKEDFSELVEFVVEAVESVTQASRAFFRNIDAVGDHNHKVMFYEKEADKTSTKLKRKIFASSIELAHKIHLRHFVENIDNVADWSEDVADRLAIYVIKRTI